MADQSVVAIVVQVAQSLGVDPRLALAIMQQESGGNPQAVGDHGTSFGLFQLHRGGELGNMSPQQAFDPWTNAHVALSQVAATQHANPGLSPGDLAAASQRPANRGAYAASVNALYNGQPTTFPTATTPAGPGATSPQPAGATPGAPTSTMPQTDLGQPIAGAAPQAPHVPGGFSDQINAYSQVKQMTTPTTTPGAVATAAPAIPAHAVPPAGTSTAQPGSGVNTAVAAALTQVGVPYGWGKESPGVSFDCSGLVQWAYSKEGVSLPRTSQAMSSFAAPTDNPQPGDLVFYGGRGTAHHVTMYLGNGMQVAADHTGTNVRVEAVGSGAIYGHVGGAPGGTGPAPQASQGLGGAAAAATQNVTTAVTQPTAAPTTGTTSAKPGSQAQSVTPVSAGAAQGQVNQQTHGMTDYVKIAQQITGTLFNGAQKQAGQAQAGSSLEQQQQEQQGLHTTGNPILDQLNSGLVGEAQSQPPEAANQANTALAAPPAGGTQ